MRRWWMFTLTVVFLGPPVLADSPPVHASGPAWQVDADRLEYDQVNKAYLAFGNVRIQQEDYTLSADKIQLNSDTHQAQAEGNVRLVSGRDVLSGRRLLFNLDDKTGTLTDGDVFLSRNHLYLRSREIRKTGPQTYTASKVQITSCDGDHPDWKLTGSDFKVTIEGYGTARNAALWAGRVPVLYSPYLIFPVKLQRQSGLLLPVIALSDRRGTEYTQPFFWAIGDSSDATLYAHTMTLRGVRTGIEYRYVASEETFGTMMVEGFDDDKVDDGTDDATERWGYGDDNEVRLNTDRYWFRMKHDQALAGDFNAKLDLDVVSDQDYLNEFRGSYNGYSDTSGYFQRTFGRELDDYNDPVRLNRLNLNRIWNRYTFNADLRWYDDVIKRRNNEPDNTLQQLPRISFDGVKQPLGGSPLYHDLTSSYTYFYRIDGPRGHRGDLYPRLYYPFDLFDGVSIEPSAGLRQTFWQVDFDELSPGKESESHSRTIYDLRLDISSEFYRIFDFSMAGSDRLKHTVTPEVIYEFTPDQDQTDLPQFDTIDTIESRNLITYGITNTFTARTPLERAGEQTGYRYTPFLRFKVDQSFDIDKDQENDPEPFSDIGAELDLTPGKYISIDADARWSVYAYQFETINSALIFWSPRGDLLSADYRYTRETVDGADDGIETLVLGGEWHVSDMWQARGGLEQNLIDHRLIETRLGVSYRSQCWGLDFDYQVEYTGERDNHSVTVMFNLLGLGSIGG